MCARVATPIRRPISLRRRPHSAVVGGGLGARLVAGSPSAPVPVGLSLHRRPVPLASPSGASTILNGGVHADLVRSPLSVVAAAGVTAAFERQLSAAGSWDALLVESTWYRGLNAPPFAALVGEPSGSIDATALFGVAATVTEELKFPTGCFPELHTVGKIEDEKPLPFAYQGEGKTKMPAGAAFQQMVTYCAMDLVRIYFPADVNEASVATPGPRRFYDLPPLGFTILALGNVAYYWSVEWAGKLVMAPISAPFFINSQEHTDAMAALPKRAPCTRELTLPLETTSGWLAPAGAVKEQRRVTWTSEPWNGAFLKLLRTAHITTTALLRLVRVYGRELPRALADAQRPPSLLRSRLLYGAHELCIEMPFVAGRNATQEELTATGAVLDAAADAVVHLALFGLVYIDLRPPNVIVPAAAATGSPAAYLVDYDDVYPLDRAVTSASALADDLDDAIKAMYPEDLEPNRNYLRVQPAMLSAIASAFARRAAVGGKRPRDE